MSRCVVLGAIVTIQDGAITIDGGTVYGMRGDLDGVTVLDFSSLVPKDKPKRRLGSCPACSSQNTKKVVERDDFDLCFCHSCEHWWREKRR